GPRARRAPVPRLRQRVRGGLDHVLDLVAADVERDARRVAVVVVVGRADDGLRAVRHEEHRAAVLALEDQAVVADASLEGDVDALARPERAARAGERGDAGGPGPA